MMTGKSYKSASRSDWMRYTGIGDDMKHPVRFLICVRCNAGFCDGDCPFSVLSATSDDS